MTPALHIRKIALGFETQAAFSRALAKLGVPASQGTISIWEREGEIPTRAQKAVREIAKVNGVPWFDSFFFEVPASTESAA